MKHKQDFLLVYMIRLQGLHQTGGTLLSFMMMRLVWLSLKPHLEQLEPFNTFSGINTFVVEFAEDEILPDTNKKKWKEGAVYIFVGPNRKNLKSHASLLSWVSLW